MAKDWTVDEFLKQSAQFQLGELPTESSHPRTKNLSELAQARLAEAYEVLTDIDLNALDKVKENTSVLIDLRQAVEDTLESGGRVFLCGCGATGRLSLSIEALWRQSRQGDERESVTAFMAGGDVALVHSIEGFEDFPEWGARQLHDQGFGPEDLLIATTEGGETPWVIGATLAAAAVARRQPFFLFCNPARLLVDRIERSRRVIEHPRVRAHGFAVGPMALAGSTRMQASTVLMLVAGWAILQQGRDSDPRVYLDRLRESLAAASERPPVAFSEREAAIYRRGGGVIYQVSDYAITVFTDTTERSPTFSLPAFDNRLHPRVKPSLVYVEIGAAPTPHAAWLQLLHRDPRPLDWDGVDHRATQDYLAGFDFSRSVTSWRRSLRADFPQAHFAIESDADAIVWRLEDLELRMGVADLDLLSRHLLLKMILNQHSTLVMGRLGRYYTNLMTYVRPNNAKLIDRAARYVGILLADAGRTDVAYDSIVREIFRRKEALAEDEAIVMSVFAALRGGDAHR